MGPRRPEVEYISLRKLTWQKQRGPDQATQEGYKCLQKLANAALKNGPFSITFDKAAPHLAPSSDCRDFLSYAPYWWPENPNDPNTKYVRRDGKRNPGSVKDQAQLESFAENFMFLCLGYHFFNNRNYADHAVLLLNTFFVDEKTRMNPHLEYAQLVRGSQNRTRMGRCEGVISSRSLSRIANCLPLLESVDTYNTVKPYVYAWFNSYLQWLKTCPIALEATKASNNIHTWYIVQISAIEHLLYPPHVVYNTLMNYFTHKLTNQVDSKTGNQPSESKRAKPFHYLVFNIQAVMFLAELALDIGMNVYQTQPLIHLAIKHITTFAHSSDLKDDITEAIRCVEITWKGIDNDTDHCCKSFLDIAYHCKYAEKINGPKNAIHVLWS
ncbi:hypothetical protein CU098_013741 [Rhizopus stolonifer]|uniref:Alginate lyase domain-containing protein n=1 Tax=Rhizopus stolonifer TaxID=4846 RepID=A0A367KYH8_RHIST|nr:hypothetical protein CU098_013741 [Rhizopus stolonifer]